MSHDRLNVPTGRIQRTIAELIAEAVQKERLRCAEVVQLYPLEGFCYDTNNHGEILRLRDTLSEAVMKVEVPGQGIK